MNTNGPGVPAVAPPVGASPDAALAALVRDRAVVAAALLDAGSGMLLAARSREGAPEDLETVCAGQADVIRAAVDAAAVSFGGPAPTEVVVAHGDRLHQVLRTVHDPLGDRLVLSLLVDGPPRALRRLRRRLSRMDTAALVPMPGALVRTAPPDPPSVSGAPVPPAPGGAPARPEADLFTPAGPVAPGPWWPGAGVPGAPRWAPGAAAPPAPVPTGGHVAQQHVVSHERPASPGGPEQPGATAAAGPDPRRAPLGTEAAVPGAGPQQPAGPATPPVTAPDAAGASPGASLGASPAAPVAALPAA
ncbi:hypothetical protein ACFQ34_18680, partial [Pseudonocardia benzenivorans]